MHPIQKPQLGSHFKEIKPPKDGTDDKKNFHFIYICRKQLTQVIDSSDEEAVAAEKTRVDAEKKQAEDALKADEEKK